MPALDVFEDKDNLTVKAELPGMKREEIDISVHDGTLTISGERRYEEKNQDAEPYRSERFFGRFHRTLALRLIVLTRGKDRAYLVTDLLYTVADPRISYERSR